MSNPIGGTFGDNIESRARDIAAEVGTELEDASRQVRRGFERVGASLDDGADKLKDGIRHTREGMRTARTKAADVLGNSTAYLRANGARDVLDDVEGLVKEHPGKALLVVAAIGFILGRSLTSRE